MIDKRDCMDYDSMGDYSRFCKIKNKKRILNLLICGIEY